jgi:hypothetical protein
MKKTLITVFGLMLLGTGVALAQYERNYSFSDVDTNGDGQISVDEAKANPDFIDEAIYHMFSKAHGDSVNWANPMEQEEWEGLTTH